MKDIVLGSMTIYNFDKIKYWVNSLDRSGFDGVKMMVCYDVHEDVITELKKRNYQIFRSHLEHNIVVQRFIDYWRILCDDNYRFVVATDVKDVVFQQNPIDWLDNNMWRREINASSESIRYINEPWGNNNLNTAFDTDIYNRIKDKIIFNAGVLSGNAIFMRDLFLHIYLTSRSSPIYNPDQAAYNVLLNTSTYSLITKYTDSEEGWAAQLGTSKSSNTNLLEPAPIMLGDSVCTSQGQPFYIVHQYDRIPEWKEIIERKYE